VVKAPFRLKLSLLSAGMAALYQKDIIKGFRLRLSTAK